MSLQDLIVQLREALSGGQVSGGLVVLFVVVVMVLIVLVTLFYALYLSSTRGRLDSLLDEQTQGARRWSLVTRLAAVVLVVVALVGVDRFVERSSGCITCHGQKTHAASLEESPHNGVECSECHSPTGPSGPARQLVSFVRWNYVYAAEDGVPDLRPGSVGSSACLRCHKSVEEGVAERGGIRVRHSDFIDQGYKCRECHNSVSHPKMVLEPTDPTMDKCLVCHDGVQAPTECSLCHTGDISDVAKYERLPVVKIEVAWDSCYSCHPKTNCSWCHGTVMPHPPEWGIAEKGGAGGHARPGFANRDVCWRCHFDEGRPFEPPASGCGSCHGLMGTQHGGTPWIREHGLQATGRKPGVFADCFSCHVSALCDYCHSVEYRQMYNPVIGEDQYQRAVPLPPEASDY